MATEVGSAYLTIIPSSKGFGKKLSGGIDPEMGTAGKSAGSKFGSGLSSSAKGIGSKAGKLIGGALVAGVGLAVVGIGAVIKTGFDESKDASAGAAQLAAGIKSTGNAANVAIPGLEALAKKIQAYSGQTDDSIVQTEALLLTFPKIKNAGVDKIFDLTTIAAADMAARMGGDASASAIRLGRALSDPVKGVTALTRVGVVFTAAQKDQITAMVKVGDVVGAQKIILGELNTEFGGSAKAAGTSLPGQMAIAKRSFEELSETVVTGLLPAFMTTLTGITGFIKGVQDGTGAGGTFRDILTAIYEKGLKPVGEFIVNTAIPAIKDFATGFANGTGPGGKFRDILTAIYDDGIVPLATFITDTALPALKSIGTWITDTGIPALSSFKDWVGKSKTALEQCATLITIVLLPVFIDMAVKAVVSAATQVTAWVSTQVAGQTSAASQFASHYVIVGGWIASAASAVASGATTVAIWAMYKWEAIQGAASVVGAHLAIAGGWIASAAAAVASGVSTAATWVAMSARSIAGAAIAVGSLIAIGAGWVASAVIATASGIAMAAAWVVGLGPVAWIIAAVVAIGAALVLAYNKVSWFRTAVDAVWQWMKNAATSVKDWIVGAWNTVVGFVTGLPGRIGSAVSGMWDGIKDSFRSALNWVLRAWNNFSFTIGGGNVMGVNIPSVTLNTPNIPLLAQGGIVPATPGGRLVRVAEAGQDEAIVPLGRGGATGGIDLSAKTINAIAAAMARVKIGLDGRVVSTSVDYRIGMALR